MPLIENGRRRRALDQRGIRDDRKFYLSHDRGDGAWIPVTEFYAGSARDGLAADCKACQCGRSERTAL